MKNFALFLLIMLILAACITPYADGYLTKIQFMKQVARTQAALNSQHTNATIKVTSYRMGWLTSNVTISFNTTIPGDNDRQPMKLDLPVDIVIHHGPIILVDNKPIIGLAYAEGYLRLPPAIQDMIPNNKDIYMKITSLLTIDQKSAITHFSIPSISIGPEFKWDGLTGSSTVNMAGRNILDAKTDMTIKRMSGTVGVIGLNYNIDPITSDAIINNADLNNTSTIATLKSGSMTISMKDKSLFNLKSIDLNSTNKIKDGIYHSQLTLLFGEITSSAIKPIDSISSIKYYFDINNLNYSGIQNLSSVMAGLEKKYADSSGTDSITDKLTDDDVKTIEAAFISALNNKSAVETTFSINTNIGKFALLIDLSLNEMPKKLTDFSSAMNARLEARISKKLIYTLLATYMKYTIAMEKKNTPEPAATIPTPTPDNGRNLYFQGVADMVMNRSITSDQSIAVMSIVDQHPATEADLETEIGKLSLPKETGEKIKTLYMSQYMPQAATESAIEVQENTDPIMAAKAVIDNLTSQGIIIEDGDAYFISFRKNANVMKLNGSTDNPILRAITAGLRGEAMPAPSLTPPSADVPDDTTTASPAGN